MKVKTGYISAFFLLLLFSCNNNSNIDAEAPLNAVNIDSLEYENVGFFDSIKPNFDENSNELLGAEFRVDKIKTKLFHFSNNYSKDTFKLFVPKGKIEHSFSKFKIINSKGKIIYSVVFPTYYLLDSYEMYTPDSIPEYLTEVQKEKYLDNYVNSISKAQFEKYYLKKINEFLLNPIVPKKHSIFQFNAEYLYVTNQKVFDELRKSKNPMMISLPIHEGEEGGSCIGFSEKNGRAFKFCEHD